MESLGNISKMPARPERVIVAAEANSSHPPKGDFERMARRRFQNPKPTRRGEWWTLRVWKDKFTNGKHRRIRERIRLAPATMNVREIQTLASVVATIFIALPCPFFGTITEPNTNQSQAAKVCLNVYPEARTPGVRPVTFDRNLGMDRYPRLVDSKKGEACRRSVRDCRRKGKDSYPHHSGETQPENSKRLGFRMCADDLGIRWTRMLDFFREQKVVLGVLTVIGWTVFLSASGLL